VGLTALATAVRPLVALRAVADSGTKRNPAAIRAAVLGICFGDGGRRLGRR
jgi:hypothetical protein